MPVTKENNPKDNIRTLAEECDVSVYTRLNGTTISLEDIDDHEKRATIMAEIMLRDIRSAENKGCGMYDNAVLGSLSGITGRLYSKAFERVLGVNGPLVNHGQGKHVIQDCVMDAHLAIESLELAGQHLATMATRFEDIGIHPESKIRTDIARAKYYVSAWSRQLYALVRCG